MAERIVLGIGLIVAVASGVASYRISGPYGDRDEYDAGVRRVYDQATGRLKLIVFDSNGNLKLDHWAYMDGERLIRMDVDEDEDGTIDRREYYGSGNELQRIERLAADGRVIRTEFYDKGTLTRTEPPASIIQH